MTLLTAKAQPVVSLISCAPKIGLHTSCRPCERLARPYARHLAFMHLRHTPKRLRQVLPFLTALVQPCGPNKSWREATYLAICYRQDSMVCAFSRPGLCTNGRLRHPSPNKSTYLRKRERYRPSTRRSVEVQKYLHSLATTFRIEVSQRVWA